jgi:hypothetical protein
MGGSQYTKLLDSRWQRYRPNNLGACLLGCIYNLFYRQIQQSVVKGFQAYSDSLPHLPSPLFYDLGAHPCTYGLPAFPDGEAELLLEGNR